MRCPTCKRQMIVLFTSCVCDHCSGPAPLDWPSGFIVFRGEDDFARQHYLFPTRTDAALYRQLRSWQSFPIREVRFEHPVQWKAAIGALQGATFAARLFQLHRDHRYESVPYSGFLVALGDRVAA